MPFAMQLLNDRRKTFDPKKFYHLLKSIALFALAASPDERKVACCKIYCLPGPYILLRDNFRTQHSVSKMDAPTDPEDCHVHPLIKTYIYSLYTVSLYTVSYRGGNNLDVEIKSPGVATALRKSYVTVLFLCFGLYVFLIIIIFLIYRYSEKI